MYLRFFLPVFCWVLCVAAVGSPIDSLNKEATYLYLDGYHADAYFIFKKNLDIQEQQENPDEEFLTRTHRNMGMCLVELNQIDKAEKHLNQAVDGYRQIITKNKDSLAYKKMINRLGVCYQHRARAMRRKGDFQRAIDDVQQALTQFQIVDKTNNIVRMNNILANIYIDKQENEKAQKQCESTIEKYLSEDISSEALADIYHTLAVSYLFQNKYKQAVKNYNEALKFTEHPADSASTFNSVGFAYLKMGDVKNSEKYLTKGLLSRQQINDNNPYHFSYTSTYENFGDLNMIKKDYDAALNYYQKSLLNQTNNFRNQDINTNPTVTGNHHIYNKPDLLRVFNLKAQAATKSGNIDLAQRTYADLDSWINDLYKDLTTNESKLTWIARAHETYAQAIATALLKNDQTKAFEYAEKAHAVLLWQNLSQQAAQSLLSEEDKERLNELTAKIRQADQQYRYGEISIEALHKLERGRQELEQTFEQKYPEYTQRKYQPEATTVSDIQKNIIDEQTAFIEYYRTDDILYIFVITKNGLEITQQPADGLADNISNFVKNISRENTNVENYHALAYKLYEQLIPSTIRSNDNIKRLIIVPDREIGTLPFAALATQTTSGKLNKNTPFLVKRYATNYLYSAGSYLQLQQQKADQPYCFAGIAPVEYQLENWNKLPHTEGELDGMKSMHWSWQREILKRETATKVEFERIIKEGYRTIQVSTHAVFDENEGQIIFYDSALNQDEIDRLEINTHRLKSRLEFCL